MSDYLKLFQAHSAYNTYINGNNVSLPNVSFCQNENEIHYNPIDFSKRYLATVARENGTISFNIWQTMGTGYITSISYSTDNGETWTTTANQDNKSEKLQITVNVNAGDKVLWKGIAQQTGYRERNNYVGSFFSSDCEFDVQGNVMSLCYGDNFIGQTTLNNTAQFACLFSDFNGNLECNVVNAKDLSLPATTLANNCYDSMFYGCTSLTSAPVLPATTLAQGCYTYMFYGTNVLPDCSNIDFTSQTVVASGGLMGLFAGTKVTDSDLMNILPINPSTNRYWLPVTTLAQSSYHGMFTDCTALTTAPQLPATTLATYCYGSMFSGCTALTTAPVLPATTLANDCYFYMFNGCSNLNYIKAMFTTTPSTSYTRSWVQGVAATGTFVKNSAAQWTTTGVNGVPSRWTVQTASE